MFESVEEYNFEPVNDKAVKDMFFSIYGTNTATVIGISIVLTLLYLSASAYYLLFVPFFCLFIPYFYFLEFKKKCSTYITKIKVNYTTRSLDITFLKHKKFEEMSLPFESYSVLKRTTLIKNLSNIEIIRTGPYKILLKQFSIGDWEKNTGYEILGKYAKNTTNQIFKPY